MTHRKLLFLLLSLSFAISEAKQTSSPPPFGGGRGEASEALSRLDESLLHREDYERQKKERIASLREQLSHAQTDSVRYSLNAELFREYSSYQYDSAYVYADRCIALAERSLDSNRQVEAKCFRVFSLLSSGLFKEAYDEHEQIVLPASAAEYYKYYYYSVSARLYYDLCDYNHGAPYQPLYIQRGGEMTDSLLRHIGPQAWMRSYYEGIRLMKEYKGQESMNSFIRFLGQQVEDKHVKAVATSCVGWSKLFDGKEDEALCYLAQAAIYDNETATKETTALTVLGGLLYRRGDVERAVRYVQYALADANFYNARHRLIQVGQILPIIEEDRYTMVARQRNLLLTLVVVALLFLLFVLAGLLFFRRQNRKLTEARRLLEQSNKQLSEANSQLGELNSQLSASNAQLEGLNSQLSEANHIKDEYIGKSFYFNVGYIHHMEKLYKTIDRKLVTHQYEDLRQNIKESSLNADRENIYGAFDETFLNIFPHFITKFNEMFDEKDRKVPDAAGSLTPEMRIFALIRLGISDSERIANFLNYSVHTINTYKTRVKNKSHVPNEEFEQRIMEI